MSFWDSVAKVAIKTYEVIGTKVQEKNEQIEAYRKSFSRMDDKKVFERINSSSFAEKAACHLELEARGYLEKNAENKYQRTEKRFPA